jgi:VWFA-related protein
MEKSMRALSWALLVLVLGWSGGVAAQGSGLEGLLEGESAEALGAGLELQAVCVEAGAAEVRGRSRCILQVVVAAASLPPTGVTLKLRLAAVPYQGPREDHERSVSTGPLSGSDEWVYLLPLEVPEDLRGLAVTVELPAGLWGGSLVEVVAEPLEVGPTAAVTEGSPWGVKTKAKPTTVSTRILRILPPKNQPVSGPTRIDTLVSLEGIDKVEFFVDGKTAGEDRHEPFSVRLELADPPRPQMVRAVAYASSGELLGEDELEVNGGSGRFRVSIRSVTGDPAAGQVTVDAAVDLPPDQKLERVEFYFNETLVTSRSEPPFRVAVPTPSAGPSDYLRVAAYLADGSTIDAVELVAAPGAVDQVNVNLVEVYAVVTDANGSPVTDLRREDFEVKVDGRLKPLEDLGLAQDLPLRLGLVVDSSGSMVEIMIEAKQAGARFLAELMRPGDQAFLVDFDTQPRLLVPLTGSLTTLLRAFHGMEPEGATALYDSLVFSVLQLGGERGRKALVLLTDGDDYHSRFGPARVIDDAHQSGVPVYVIGLGNPKLLKKIVRQNDLDRITEKTGGRVFLAEDADALGLAYGRINAELRSQYLLTFYADPDTPLGNVQVQVRKPGLEVRSVVGAR